MGAVYNQREWFITNLDLPGHLLYEENETLYQQLWKQYFASTAIQDRVNPRLQRQFMPARYSINAKESTPPGCGLFLIIQFGRHGLYENGCDESLFYV
ncbi:hypothetical protein P378_02510 [Desulforamulus profundi]|uniref:DUF4130 domain-containing protein n=1 Tax=Desulforamulus profundi TaxID=1383067 RepID=A0A2C6MIM6_9FIRM|nr:hypothetical protein P378_02510 [Desulforamulus profundi]